MSTFNWNGAVEERGKQWEPAPLDPTLYNLQESEKEFFQTLTTIETDDDLQEHILRVQKDLYAIAPYPCVRLFSFTRLFISRHESYASALNFAKETPDALFLEVGPGLGTELRKLVHDGYPPTNVVAIDLHQVLWDGGHRLFKSSPESFPVTFVQGDIFKLTDSIEGYSPTTSPPDLSSLSKQGSVLPLKGHLAVIYTCRFFHLFSEELQKQLAERLFGLLSPRPGALIFGAHLASDTKGVVRYPEGELFCHSPSSWVALWENVCGKGNIQVTTRLESREVLGMVNPVHVLYWGVTRL